MANEMAFQKNVVIDYFTDTLKGLGYSLLSKNVFDSKTLIVKPELESFLLNSTLKNKNSLTKCIKDYKGDTKLFWEDFILAISNYIYQKHNIALYIKKEFEFKGQKFELFCSSYQKFNNAFNKNRFSIIDEPYIEGYKNNQRFIYFKPDIGIYINGIFVSYLELKFEGTGQNAKIDGRGKVIEDFCNFTRATLNEDNELPTDKEILLFQKPFLNLLHINVMDTDELYCIRNLRDYQDEALNVFTKRPDNEKALKKQIKETFLLEPTSYKREDLEPIEKIQLMLFNMFSKRALEKEIYHYNLLAYKRYKKEGKTGKVFDVDTNSQKLISPRPDQKYMVDLVINHIENKLYENENNQDYFVQNLYKKLSNIPGLSEADKNSEIVNRLEYDNQNKIFSILLQAAAGFGKTYIMCWLSSFLLPLKKKEDNLFDKILLVTDRVDLREQLEQSMYDVIESKSIFCNIESKKIFQEFLIKDTTRVGIVNVQKFQRLNNVLTDDIKKKLKDMRVAFIIDEIHRSQSGTQHDSMVNLFSDISESIADKDRNKKNLIIGLTATPKPEDLARWGEFDGCVKTFMWKPFASYTHKQSIKDGFTLDPILYLQPIKTIIKLEQVNDKEIEAKPKDIKSKIYENEEVIRWKSEKMVEILLHETYKKIRCNGKAMLACYSIQSAKTYFYEIKKQLELLCLSNPKKYQNYIDVKIWEKVFVVYTTDQKNKEKAYKKSGLSSEEEVIKTFKKIKNGLIIVVDKLQTGFDEPLLHTLFLDKETSGISAYQTVCRVNRTVEYKDECFVFDFSYKNKNCKNIQESFEMFENLTTSNFNLLDIKKQILKLFDNLINHTYSEQLISYSQNTKDDTLLIADCKNLYYSEYEIFTLYVNAIREYDNKKKLFALASYEEITFETSNNFKVIDYEYIFKKVKEIYNSLEGRDVEDVELIPYIDEESGEVILPEYFKKEKINKEDKLMIAPKGKKRLYDLIEKFNKEADAEKIDVKLYEEKYDELLEAIYKLDSENGCKFLVLAIRDEVNMNDFKGLFNRSVRTILNKENEFFINKIKPHDDGIMEDYIDKYGR